LYVDILFAFTKQPKYECAGVSQNFIRFIRGRAGLDILLKLKSK